MKLSKSEEELMSYLWQLGKAFMKDLLEAYPEPKPAATTVSTLLKRMQDKKYVAYKAVGNNRQYFPLVSKEIYFSKDVSFLDVRYFYCVLGFVILKYILFFIFFDTYYFT